MLILAISLSTLHKHFHPWVNKEIYITWKLWLLSRKVSFPTTESLEGEVGCYFVLRKWKFWGSGGLI